MLLELSLPYPVCDIPGNPYERHLLRIESFPLPLPYGMSYNSLGPRLVSYLSIHGDISRTRASVCPHASYGRILLDHKYCP